MKLTSKFCSVLIFLMIIDWSIEDTERNVLEQILNYHPSNINALVARKVNEQNNETADVYVNLFVRMIETIDDKNAEIKMQVRLRMSWVDSRLSYQHLDEMKREPIDMIRLTDTSKVWIPDVFFSNEKQSHEHNLIQPNSFVRIYPNGTVLFSKRLSLTLSCPLNFKKYPHDAQVCIIRIAVYQSTRNSVNLRWKPNDSVQIVKNIHMKNFVLERFQATETISKSNGDDYSVVQVDFLFQRNFFCYFKKFYVPVVITVLISWVPLWLERVLILRIYVAMSTVMYLAWYYTVQDPDLSISYNTALHTWNAANFIFVILAALESLMIVFMIKTNKNAIKRIHPDDNDEFKMIPNDQNKSKVLDITDEKLNLDAEIMKIKTNFKICFINVHKEVQIIDAAARLFFPSAYTLFLFFYWITYQY
ncbi:glutamate-gated chloride channel-like [Planococcus citri]|uniref:glutamate-gated chloride channel-like n=1 Tax=Planococcus citri TaxID=170843 RepID=UPI0031F7FDD7